MIANILVILIVISYTLRRSQDGLFMAFLQLVNVIVAALLAFALWQPLVISLLIDRMPEFSWGVGLIALFALFMVMGSQIMEKLVQGNASFGSMAYRFGGMGLGVINGIIVAGMLMIGLPLLGSFDAFGYRAYQLSAEGQPERVQRLWIPVDDLTAAMFGYFANGATHPSFGPSLTDQRPNLIAQIHLGRLAAFEHGRVTVAPEHVRMPSPSTLLSASMPERLDLPQKREMQYAMLPFNILPDSDSQDLLLDNNGYFMLTRAQTSLVVEDRFGTQLVYYPIGYITQRQYFDFRDMPVDLSDRNEAAVALIVDDQPVDLTLVYHIAESDEPRFAQLKRLTFTLNETEPIAMDEIAEMARLSAGLPDRTQPSQPRAPGEGTNAAPASDAEPQAGGRSWMQRAVGGMFGGSDDNAE